MSHGGAEQPVLDGADEEPAEPAEPGQTDAVAGIAEAADVPRREPSLTITEAAHACGVDREEIELRQRQGAFPNAWRADPEPGRSAFQSLWRVPVVDLEDAGLTVDPAALPHICPPADDAELERLRGELDEWQRRALLAEAIAEERLHALEDARQALKTLAVAFEAHNGAPPEPEPGLVDEDELEPAPANRLRGNWLR